MLRNIFRCATRIIKLLWGLITIFCKFRKKKLVNSTPGNNWNEDWEEFSVFVVPNNSESTSQKITSEVDGKQECDVIDEVLSGMQPVLKKARKIRIKSNSSDTEKLVDFTVQDTLQEDTIEELGTWNDENDKQSCWEEELLMDEGELIQATETVIKENRKKERHSRRQTNNSIRAQHRTTTTGPSLGIKQTLVPHKKL